MLKRYLDNVILGFNQFLNALLLGDPDERISSRTGRAIASGKPKWFVPPFAFLLNGFFRVVANQENHIKDEIEHDEDYKRELWSWIKD